jgi:outer membrane immunogenic protein
MRELATGVVGALLVSFVGIQAGSAADLPLPAAAPIAAVPSWTGFYVGANGGAGWGTTESNVNVGATIANVAAQLGAAVPPITLGIPLPQTAYNGFLGGVDLGYNWQTGIFVVGVEGDFDGGSLQGNTSCAAIFNCNVKHSWFADATARVGVVAFDKALIYVKGGAAWTNTQYNLGNSLTVGGVGSIALNASGSGIMTGGELGIGVEYPFLPNWFARLEYDHIEFGNQTLNLNLTTTPPLPIAIALPTTFHDSMNLVKVGIDYRFW